jgi:hypothetical protein
MGELSFVFVFDALALDINPTLNGTNKPLDQARILPTSPPSPACSTPVEA